MNPEDAEQALINELLSRQSEQEEEEEEEEAPTGIDGIKRQGAGSVSNAPAGEDKTASYTPLFSPHEKTAGPVNFLKNLTGRNVAKSQNKLDTIKSVPTDMQKRYEYTKNANKELSNAKVDRNRALLGGGTALVAGGAGLGGYNAYQNSKKPVVDNTMNQQQYPNYEQKIAFDSLMSRLEKTAAPFDPRLGASLAAAQIGQNIGNAGHAIKNVGRDAVDALGPGYGNRLLGKEYRDVSQGASNTVQGQQLSNDALKQMLLAQGITGAGVLGAAGAGHAMANGGDDDEEQVAFEDLMGRLEKTAEEGSGRQDRRFLTESFLGAGPVGYLAKKHNSLGINEEDSHAVANAKLGLLGGGISGAGQGALMGALASKSALGAGLGAAAGGLGGAALYGLSGAGIGALHDRYDRKHPVQDEEQVENVQPTEEQLAFSELLERLEKTAASGAGLFGKAKKAIGDTKYKAQMGVRDLTGANTKATGQNMQKMWEDPKHQSMSVDEFKKSHDKLKGANDAAVNRQSKAKRNATVGAAGLAAGGAGVAGANAVKKDEEKTAEELMSGLYKEAASAIINESLPPVRQHVDPMSKITFSR